LQHVSGAPSYCEANAERHSKENLNFSENKCYFVHGGSFNDPSPDKYSLQEVKEKARDMSRKDKFKDFGDQQRNTSPTQI